MERLLTSHAHLINDAQVNLLANEGHYTRLPDSEDLQKAEGVIVRSAFPGVVEMFDLSMKAARYYGYPAFGSLDLEHTELNVSPDRGTTLETRLRGMEEACGSDVFNALVETNKLDQGSLVRRKGLFMPILMPFRILSTQLKDATRCVPGSLFARTLIHCKITACR